MAKYHYIVSHALVKCGSSRRYLAYVSRMRLFWSIFLSVGIIHPFQQEPYYFWQDLIAKIRVSTISKLFSCIFFDIFFLQPILYNKVFLLFWYNFCIISFGCDVFDSKIMGIGPYNHFRTFVGKLKLFILDFLCWVVVRDSRCPRLRNKQDFCGKYKDKEYWGRCKSQNIIGKSKCSIM